MRVARCGFSIVIALIMTLVLGGSGIAISSARAAEDKKDLPPRAISIAPAYTGVIVPQGKDVSVDLDVKNGGRSDEDVDLSFKTIPEGWDAVIKTYSFEVTGVYVPSDSSKSLTLKLDPKPKEGVPPGEYNFVLEGRTPDGALTSTANLKVIVKKKEAEKKEKGVKISTSYPVLQGPTDGKFEFSLEVESDLEKDAIFNLMVQGPENWDMKLKPAYEDKYISSLRIKANQSQTMAVEVKPYPLAEPGRYPIKVKVSSENAKAEADLVVILTGTYKLEAGTVTGLLSLDAYQGKPANFSFYVKNTGSAAQNDVKFLSFKPENWTVEFKPEKFDTIGPGELKQVEAVITPSEQALVGDYSVALSIQGEKSNKTLETRVTVRASTVWGWVGIGIIVLVLAGLVFLFVRMGRR